MIMPFVYDVILYKSEKMTFFVPDVEKINLINLLDNICFFNECDVIRRCCQKIFTFAHFSFHLFWQWNDLSKKINKDERRTAKWLGNNSWHWWEKVMSSDDQQLWNSGSLLLIWAKNNAFFYDTYLNRWY
jgi:hypothetical protein